jgi:hypothetical protein
VAASHQLSATSGRGRAAAPLPRSGGPQRWRRPQLAVRPGHERGAGPSPPSRPELTSPGRSRSAPELTPAGVGHSPASVPASHASPLPRRPRSSPSMAGQQAGGGAATQPAASRGRPRGGRSWRRQPAAARPPPKILGFAWEYILVHFARSQPMQTPEGWKWNLREKFSAGVVIQAGLSLRESELYSIRIP